MKSKYERKTLKLLLSDDPKQLKGISPPNGKDVHFLGLLEADSRKLYLCVTSDRQDITDAIAEEVQVYAGAFDRRRNTAAVQKAEEILDIQASESEAAKGMHVFFRIGGGEAQLYFPVKKTAKSEPFLLLRREFFMFEPRVYDLLPLKIPEYRLGNLKT